MRQDLRIAVDATVVTERPKGAGRVIINLLRTLPGLAPGVSFLALARRQGVPFLRDLPDAVEPIVLRDSRDIRLELVELNRRARTHGAALLFAHREIAGFGGPPTVLHIAEPPAYRLRRDTIRETRPPLKWIAKDLFAQATLRSSIHRATAITCGSHTTAEWLHRRFGIDPVVIYPGIDPAFFADDGERPPTAAKPYFLHPATGDARENTDLVLRGFARANRPGVGLRLVGTPDQQAASIRRRAEALGIAAAVEIEGWVSDQRLRNLYLGAVALIHPTRFECFAGLQALEAMACGTPVIALKAPGATEGLEGASVLLDHEDPDELAATLRRMLDDEELRRSLSVAGRARAQSLTWETAATAFMSVFEEVLVSGSRRRGRTRAADGR